MAWPPNVFPPRAFITHQVFEVFTLTELPDELFSALHYSEASVIGATEARDHLAYFLQLDSAVRWAEEYFHDWVKDDDGYLGYETVLDPQDKKAMVVARWDEEFSGDYAVFVEPHTVEICR